MELEEFFILCEKEIPSQASELRRISLALRRSGITKIQELYNTMKNSPEEILALRDIGTKSMIIIDKVCVLYEERYERE